MKDKIEQIFKAIQYIEDHLDDGLGLPIVAKKAGISPYHFHRSFSAICGETLKEYIRKRRLSVAAKKIRNSETRILDIAMGAKFETQETFSRAFKKQYGVNPGEYRTLKFDSTQIDKKMLSLEQLSLMQKNITLTPQYTTRSAFRVVGLGGTFDMDDYEEICNLWETFGTISIPGLNFEKESTYGVCCDEHPLIEKNHEEQFCYIVGAEVSFETKVPDGLISIDVPKQKYAVFTHRGQMKDFIHTLNYIWGTWLLKAGNKKEATPDFELYDHRFDLNDPKSEVDIYVPMK